MPIQALGHDTFQSKILHGSEQVATLAQHRLGENDPVALEPEEELFQVPPPF
jgi:hypothetical protein